MNLLITRWLSISLCSFHVVRLSATSSKFDIIWVIVKSSRQRFGVCLVDNRLWSRGTKDRMGSHTDDNLRAHRHTADFSLSVQHRQLHGQLFPHILQARLLRHLMLREVRPRPSAAAPQDAASARTGCTTQHSVRDSAGDGRLQQLSDVAFWPAATGAWRRPEHGVDNHSRFRLQHKRRHRRRRHWHQV